LENFPFYPFLGSRAVGGFETYLLIANFNTAPDPFFHSLKYSIYSQFYSCRKVNIVKDAEKLFYL
jgi:hypothetical protein